MDFVLLLGFVLHILSVLKDFWFLSWQNVSYKRWKYFYSINIIDIHFFMIKKLRNKIRFYRLRIFSFFKKLLSFIKENFSIFFTSFIILLIFFFQIDIDDKYKIIYKDNVLVILSLIVGSLSSILGIVVAIQLVAFEILRKTFFHLPLRNSSVQNIVGIFL